MNERKNEKEAGGMCLWAALYGRVTGLLSSSNVLKQDTKPQFALMDSSSLSSVYVGE